MHMISTTGYRGQHTFVADTAVSVIQHYVSGQELQAESYGQ